MLNCSSTSAIGAKTVEWKRAKNIFCKYMRYPVFFIFGALGYALIELLWRGRTHWSMLIAGGICFIIFSVVCERMAKTPIWIKAAVCAMAITAVEFAFGLVVNVALGMNVWNYSDVPFNLLGQICPTFTLLWACLAIPLIPLANYMNGWLIA